MRYLGPAIFFLLLALLGFLPGPSDPPVRRLIATTREYATVHTEQPTHRPTSLPVLIRGQVGFYRLTQDSTGVWWLLSPADQKQFLCSVATVQPLTEADSSDLNTWAQST